MSHMSDKHLQELEYIVNEADSYYNNVPVKLIEDLMNRVQELENRVKQLEQTNKV